MISYSGTQLDSLTKVSGIPKSEIGTLSGIDITALEDSPFITEWETTTANESITLPLPGTVGLTFDFIVSWGDGTQSTITSYDDTDRVHTYASAGTYIVSIMGTCDGWSFLSVNASHSKIKKILSFGSGSLFTGFKNLYGGFYSCDNLTSIGITSIKPNNLLYVDGIFSGCSSLQSIHSKVFNFCKDITILNSSFAYCTSLTAIPSGLFDSLYSVATASGCFYGCSNIVDVPTELFRNQRSCYGFTETFYGMDKAVLNRNIFYKDGEQGTRFIDSPYAVSFSQTFLRATYSGVQGEAPELWNCTYTETPTKYNCFYGGGNNSTSLSNYASIPTEWKT